MSTNEHSKWREFLSPVVQGLSILMAAAALSFQHSDSGALDSRVSVVESKIESVGELRKDVNELSKSVHELIGEIRAGRRMNK